MGDLGGAARRLAAALCTLAAAAVLAACGAGDEPGGTELNARNPAPAADFTLTDQFGSEVSLSGLRDRVVVLAFLYTHCPDICPVVADHLVSVRDRLSGEPGALEDVSMLVVSVDPERDSERRAHEYSERYGMLSEWSYLVGEREALERVWSDYYVSPLAASGGSVDSLADAVEAAHKVDHQAPVYLIDREGMMRTAFLLPFDPNDVANRVLALLGEGG